MTLGPGWARFRLPLLVVASGIAFVAACGLISPRVFHQPTTLKYALTVAVPAGLALLALTRRPLRLLVALTIAVAPFDYVMTLKGLSVAPVHVLTLLALVVALTTQRPGRGRALGPATTAAALLMLPPIFAGTGPSHYLSLVGFTIAIGWLCYVVAREPSGARYVLLALGFSAALQGLLAVWEFKSGHRLNLYSASGAEASSAAYFFAYGSAVRSSGALPDPIGLGQVLALALPVLLALIVSERARALRVTLIGAALIATLGLVLSFSRMSWIGALAGVVLTIVLLPPRWRVRALAGTVVALVAIAAAGLSIGGRPLQKRLESVLSPTSARVKTAQGDRLRQRIWSAAVKTAVAHPITGTGFGRLVGELDKRGVSIQLAAHAHNTYLQFLAEGGLLGGAALLIWLAAAVLDVLAAWLDTERVLVAGVAGALLAMLVTWATDFELRYLQVSAVVAVVFGVIAALGAAGRGPRLAFAISPRRPRLVPAE